MSFSPVCLVAKPMKLSDVEQLCDSYANLQSTPISINMLILFCVCWHF